MEVSQAFRDALIKWVLSFFLIEDHERSGLGFFVRKFCVGEQRQKGLDPDIYEQTKNLFVVSNFLFGHSFYPAKLLKTKMALFLGLIHHRSHLFD